ncbi:sialate O-acetylesterase [Actinomycetes bacterium M1A6_2h]
MTEDGETRDRTADRREHGDFSRRSQWTVRGKNSIKRMMTSGTPAPDLGEPYLVVPVLGQSNAHGSGLPADPGGLDAPNPRVHQWPACGRRTGTIVLGGEPLLHDVPGPGIGFSSTFAAELAAETGRPVLLVPAARGDTSFYPKNGFTWDPADRTSRVNLYVKAVALIDSALAAVPGNELAAILWHQGESDVPLLPPSQYRTKLDSLVEGMRGRYGSVPFLLGRMVPELVRTGHPGYRGIDAVHVDTPNRHDLCAVVDGPEGMTNSENDPHYSAVGQRELGRRMFDAYLEVISRP